MTCSICECGAFGYVRSATYRLPLCDDCHRIRIARGIESEPDPEVNVSPAPDGAVGWWYREPEAVGREGCDLEIEIGGRIMYQQRPPTHVGGSAYRQPKVHRTVAREIGESRAAKINAALDALTPAQRDVMRLKLAGHTHATIADELGIAQVTVDERVRRGRKAMGRKA